ncbi:MAG: hypothetical protein HQM13_19425 [SAR324 cluster bacterium]|nr:hypothetical protein [SAR324 cluster bacterium]
MRRIVVLCGVLIFLCIIGYFMYLNNHKVHLDLFGGQNVHLSLWIIIFVMFIFGFSFSWLYQFFFHPGRLVQRTKQALLGYQNTKREQRLHHFYDACLRLDFKSIRTAFNRLKRSDSLPLHIRIQYLEQQRYQQSSAYLLEAFQELKQQFPGNLQVLLSYQKLAIETREWGLVEILCQELLQIENDHPVAADGLRQVYQQREEWEKCVEQEKKILSKFPKSLVSEKLLSQHEAHLLQGFEQNPRAFLESNLNYLPGKSSFKEFHRVPLAIGEAQQLCQTEQYFKAADLLKRCYEKTAAPAVLDELESIFHQTGRSEKVMAMLQELRQSTSSTLYVELVLARLYFQVNQMAQAQTILEKLRSEYQTLPLLFHALNYLIANKEKDQEKQLQAFHNIVDSDALLKHLYSCRQCGESGNWKPVCPRCHHTYSYVYREKLI